MIRTPEDTRRLEAQIKLAAQIARRLQGFELLDGPLYALVVGVWPRIQRMPDRKHTGRQWRPSRPDWDNVAKLVLDALSGVAYRDDAQIVHGQAMTVYAAADEPAGIEVFVWRAPVFP
jgi:Holliday junction resolvase RusA-like endonuclease